MSSGSKECQYRRGDQEQEEAVYVNVERLQKATGNQVVQRTIHVELKTRSFRACAVCVTVLCVLLTAGLIGVSTYHHSTITELQTKYENVTQEKDQWKSSYGNLTLEVNQLKRRAAQSCSSGWMKFGDSCYYRSAALKPWEEHRKLCQETPGADLVIINSQEEQEFIEGLITGDDYASWLGLKRTAGNWTWVDGTPLTQHWGNGSLQWNNGDDNCVYFWKGNWGKWGNDSCSHAAFRMCEKLHVS